MNLVEPTNQHFREMASWVSDQNELQRWAGPNARFPMTANSLMEDFRLAELISYSLLNQSGQFIAFGQCYERLGCCHLGRLIVAPQQRGKGVVDHLIRRLSEVGCAELKTSRCSLFVFEDNFAAISAYEKYGFDVVTYPQAMPMKDCLYMTRVQSIQSLL
jgi:ribosomal protein S18 acetylase RimI-like enzyme